MYGEQVLREMVWDTLRSCAPHTYSGKRIKLSPIAEGALNSFIVRLRHGRNARNALMLLRRIACHTMPPPPRQEILKVLYIVTPYSTYWSTDSDRICIGIAPAPAPAPGAEAADTWSQKEVAAAAAPQMYKPSGRSSTATAAPPPAGENSENSSLYGNFISYIHYGTDF